MYVSSKLNFEVVDENTLNASCEDIWVCEKNIKTFKKSLVASIYRHLSSDTISFVQTLDNKINDLYTLNYKACLNGDFNLNNSINRGSSVFHNFLDMRASNSICPMITQPIRVTDTSSTIIDHVITNCISHSILPGIIKSALTNHYLVFCSINHPINTTPSNKCVSNIIRMFESKVSHCVRII